MLVICVLVLYLEHLIGMIYFADADCTDQSGFNITYNDQFYPNCTDIAADPDSGEWLCMIYGWEGMECCSSCSKHHGDIDTEDLNNKHAECSLEDTFQFTLKDGDVLTCSDIATNPAYTYYCKYYRNYCCESCKNIDTGCVDVPWNLTIRENEHVNCSVLATKYPVLCETDQFGTECCNSCVSTSLNSTFFGCYTNPLKYWMTFDNKKLYCEDYVSRDPSVCQEQDVLKECCPTCQEMAKCTDKADLDVLLDSNVRITSCHRLASYYPQYCKEEHYGGEGNVCCKSCTGIDATCLNSGIFFVAPNGEPITSCSMLASRFPYYCKNEFYGGEGNKCCSSCKNVDLSCVDDPNKFWQDTDGSPLYCPEAVAKDLLRCFSTGCCQSCKFECSDEDYVTITLPREDISMKCSTLVKQYPYFCKLRDYSGAMGKCCVSCKNIDTDCVDNPLFVMKQGNQSLTCDNFIGEKAHLCRHEKNNITQKEKNNITQNCCQTCPRIQQTTYRPTIKYETISNKYVQATEKIPSRTDFFPGSQMESNTTLHKNHSLFSQPENMVSLTTDGYNETKHVKNNGVQIMLHQTVLITPTLFIVVIRFI